MVPARTLFAAHALSALVRTNPNASVDVLAKRAWEQAQAMLDAAPDDGEPLDYVVVANELIQEEEEEEEGQEAAASTEVPQESPVAIDVRRVAGSKREPAAAARGGPLTSEPPAEVELGDIED